LGDAVAPENDGEHLQSRHGKRVPDILDCGDAFEDFVDEITRIDEDGVISHIIFTRRQRNASSYSKAMERRVVARLIVPTHMVKLMGRLLLADNRNDHVPMPEEARLH
jgi:hypothetical protein